MSEVHVSPRPAKKKQDKAKERKKKEEVKTPAHAKGSSKVWEAIFPSIIYTWQDVNDNNLCTVEVHMPSGSISSDFHLELEQDESCPNEPQVLLIRYRVGACFFHEEAFDTFITDVVQNVRDASSMSLARHNKIKALKQKYSDKHDIANRHCQMEMRVHLHVYHFFVRTFLVLMTTMESMKMLVVLLGFLIRKMVSRKLLQLMF